MYLKFSSNSCSICSLLTLKKNIINNSVIFHYFNFKEIGEYGAFLKDDIKHSLHSTGRVVEYYNFMYCFKPNLQNFFFAYALASLFNQHMCV